MRPLFECRGRPPTPPAAWGNRELGSRHLGEKQLFESHGMGGQGFISPKTFDF